MAFAGRIWYNVAINTKGLLRFLALSTVWDKFRLRFGTQQTPPGYVERRPPAPRRWGGFSVCVGHGKRPGDAKPVNGFFVSHGKQRGLQYSPSHSTNPALRRMPEGGVLILSFFSFSARTADSRPPGYQSPPPARWRCTATCRTGNRSPDSCCSPPPTGSSPPGGSGHSGNTPAGG